MSKFPLYLFLIILYATIQIMFYVLFQTALSIVINSIIAFITGIWIAEIVNKESDDE